MAQPGCKRRLSNILRDELAALPFDAKEERKELMDQILKWRKQELLEYKARKKERDEKRKKKKEKERNAGITNPSVGRSILDKALQKDKGEQE